MKEKKLKFKNEKGITLIALILTILLMLIIIGISVNTGMESYQKTEMEGFYTQLDIVQKKVDYIATTNERYDMLGESLNTNQIYKLSQILEKEGSNLGLEVSNFKYFTREDVERLLGLSDIKYNVFVDFKTRTIIAEEGITINGETYHILPKTVYNVELDNSINDKWSVNTLTYTIEKYGIIYYPNNANATNNSGVNGLNALKDKYKEQQKYIITVTPKNKSGEEMLGGTLMYKKSNSNNWKTANDFRFVITEIDFYDILYVDNNQNKKQGKIQIIVSSKGVPMISQMWQS